MVFKPADLTGTEDTTNKNYFTVVVTDLDTDTDYDLQFAWVYDDNTIGSPSATKTVHTQSESDPDAPGLGEGDVLGGNGLIYVTWSGKNSQNQTLKGFDRVEIYITNSSNYFGDGTKPVSFFKTAGQKTIAAPEGVYTIKLRAVSLLGKYSQFSTARTVTVSAPEPIENPIRPVGFSARSILGGIEVTWGGSYLNNATWAGFNVVNIYAGTSETPTAGTYTRVGQMTGNKTTNKIVIPIDGTYVRYDHPTYIHATALNRATPPVESDISANVASATPSQVVDTDIIDAAITEAKIALNAVTALKIAANAVTEVKIDNNAITAAKIAANAVTETKIASDSITSPKILAGSITSAKIDTGAITADKVAANAIEADKIAANAVTSQKIIANAITSDKIEANAITSGKIVSGAITAEKIAALAITGDKIAANTIDVDKLAANTISVENLSAGDISSSTYIRAGTAGSARIEISSATVGSVLPGLTVYSSQNTAIFRADLSGNVTFGGYTPADIATISSNTATASSKADTAYSAAQLASIAASDATTTANGKNKIFRTGTQPTATSSGDIWVNTSDGNLIKIWDGSTWQTARDGGLTNFNQSGNIISPVNIPSGQGAIYAGKSTFASSDSGWYIGYYKSGNTYSPALNIGDASAYLKWNTSGDGLLAIRGNIAIGSTDYIHTDGTFELGNSKINFDGTTLSVEGNINATSGYIGGNQGWLITNGEITSKGGSINLGEQSAGSIIFADATIESSSGYFSILDSETGYAILTTYDNFLNGAVILGDVNGKMTSVAKSATVTGSTTTGANSRGLRNMFTIQENYYNSSNFSSDATNGDVLLVYV